MTAEVTMRLLLHRFDDSQNRSCSEMSKCALQNRPLPNSSSTRLIVRGCGPMQKKQTPPFTATKMLRLGLLGIEPLLDGLRRRGVGAISLRLIEVGWGLIFPWINRVPFGVPFESLKKIHLLYGRVRPCWIFQICEGVQHQVVYRIRAMSAANCLLSRAIAQFSSADCRFCCAVVRSTVFSSRES